MISAELLRTWMGANLGGRRRPASSPDAATALFQPNIILTLRWLKGSAKETRYIPKTSTGMGNGQSMQSSHGARHHLFGLLML